MRRIVPVLLLIGGVASADVPVEVPPTAQPPKQQQQPPRKGGGRTKRAPKTTQPPPPPPAAQGSKDRYLQQPGAPSELPAPPITTHKEGDYGGVTPGTAPSTEAHHRATLAAKGTLSWIGFEAKDGGAQVFLQSVAPFEITQQVVGAQLYVYAALPRLAQNAWRQVDTRYFDNPLAGIQAHVVGAARATKDHPAHAAGVEIRFAFKNPKDAHEATVRTATEADNLAYVYLAFPEGTAATATPAPAATKDPEK